MNNQNLGFVPYPRARVLYVGKRHGNVGWYEYDIDADEPIIPELPAVRGYLADVYAATFVRDGKPTDKLCVSLNIGDQLITIETGLNTVFAHHLLAALVDMPVPKDEGRPITIGVEPGDKVVFARVWDADDRRVMIPDDLEGVETRALLAEVRGRWFGVDESPPPPDAAEDEPVNDDEPENPYADKAERIHKRLLVVEDFDAAYRKAAEMIDEWPEAERQLGIRALEQAVLARRPQKPLTHEELLGEPQTTR